MPPPPPPMKLPLVSKPSPSPSSSTSTSTRWLAIQTRDPRFTNTFVYAVLTTKIYCRPTCPARLARRANVRFYDTASQAERAGFRACKRCKPEKIIINNINKNSNTLEEDNTGGGGGNFSTAFHPQIQSVQRACQTIRASVRAGSKPTLRELAAEAGLTTSHFHRVFKRIVGVTVGRYVSDVMRGMGCDGDEDGENTGGDRDGLDGNGDGNGPVLLWNDFDVLLAAEEGFFAMQDVQPGVVVQDEELLAWRAVGSFGVGGGYSVDETLQALDTTTNDAL